MVWGGFSAAGKTSLALLTGRQNSINYQETLRVHLLPFTNRIMNGAFVFQHDNASIHASASTRAFMTDSNVAVLPWPSLSPDLNPIENLWGDMVRIIYAGGMQYEDLPELRVAILRAWDEIPVTRLLKLVSSMNDRCMDVLVNKGDKVGY